MTDDFRAGIVGPAVGAFLLAMFLSIAQAQAQEDFEVPSDQGSFGLTDSERDIFRTGRKRRDLPCKIRVSDASLWFDFRLHAGFEAVIAKKDLEKAGAGIRLAARVTPIGSPERAAAIVWDVSRSRLLRDPNVRQASVSGMLLLGEGEYWLDWLVRDQNGRACYERKKIKAKLGRGDRDVQLRLGPGEFEFYRGAATWASDRSRVVGPLRIKLLLYIPPFSQPDRRLYAVDVQMLISIVDRIAADPSVGRLDIVGFNLRDRKVLFRQEDARMPDYDGLWRSMTAINNHEIQLDALRKGSSARFLTELINRELIDADGALDAAVFIGPRVPLRRNVSDEVLDGLDPSQLPIYYLRYRYTPWGGNWKDSISRVVSAGGGREFGILRPKDLWVSVEKILAEVGRRAAIDPPGEERAAGSGP